MTPEQQHAIHKLRRCRLYHWRERQRVHAWGLMLDCDPALELAPHEDRALMGLLHHYRRQHKACRCADCFAKIMQAAADKASQLPLEGLFGQF